MAMSPPRLTSTPVPSWSCDQARAPVGGDRLGAGAEVELGAAGIAAAGRRGAATASRGREHDDAGAAGPPDLGDVPVVAEPGQHAPRVGSTAPPVSRAASRAAPPARRAAGSARPPRPRHGPASSARVARDGCRPARCGRARRGRAGRPPRAWPGPRRPGGSRCSTAPSRGHRRRSAIRTRSRWPARSHRCRWWRASSRSWSRRWTRSRCSSCCRRRPVVVSRGGGGGQRTRRGQGRQGGAAHQGRPGIRRRHAPGVPAARLLLRGWSVLIVGALSAPAALEDRGGMALRGAVASGGGQSGSSSAAGPHCWSVPVVGVWSVGVWGCTSGWTASPPWSSSVEVSLAPAAWMVVPIATAAPRAPAAPRHHHDAHRARSSYAGLLVALLARLRCPATDQPVGGPCCVQCCEVDWCLRMALHRPNSVSPLPNASNAGDDAGELASTADSTGRRHHEHEHHHRARGRGGRRANATGLQPVVFVHGLWLLPSSWDRWATSSRRPASRALTPGWPDDPETVEEANAHPEVFAEEDRRPGRRPLRRDHRRARPQAGRDRPLVRRAADADHRRPRAVRRVGRDRPGAVPRRAAAAVLGAEVGVPVLGNPANSQPRGAAHLRPVPLRVRQRGQRGGGASSSTRPSPCPPPARRSSRPPRPTSTRGPRPRSTRKNPERGPLLIISGEKDNTVPWAIANASYKQQKTNEASPRSSRSRAAATR